MNRRDFLEMLGLAAVAAATPKFIFDMGKNSHLYTRKVLILDEWEVDGATVSAYSCGRLEVTYSDEAVRLLKQYEVNQAFLKAKPLFPAWMYAAAVKTPLFKL